MADEHPCATPDCTIGATAGPLCHVCEGKWMNERDAVVEYAEFLTRMAASFRLWCLEHGKPDPFKD